MACIFTAYNGIAHNKFAYAYYKHTHDSTRNKKLYVYIAFVHDVNSKLA